MDWYLSLPPAEAQVACGGGTHAVRWERGRLQFPAHPDAEAERVLAALGGDTARCLQAAETWARHADDLEVLMTGPRSVADTVTADWDEAEQHRATLLGLPTMASTSRTRPGGGGAAGFAGGITSGLGPPGLAGGRTHPGAPHHKLGGRPSEEFLLRVQARIELLQLVALGPALQFRLAGTVSAAWALDARAPQRAGRQPELTAALTGRAAPAVAGWIGISPDAVMVTPMEPHGAAPPSPRHSPASWGSLDVLGTGARRLVRASLPVGWLASVWACGLALVGGHLVVAVEEPGWPRVRVLALREPGAAPERLDVTGTDSGPIPSWQLITR
jgi:hypothetical protein